MHRGNESLFAACGPHDQDGRHANIWLKLFKNLLQSLQADFHEICYVASRLEPIIVCSNDDPGVTLTYFTARSNLVTLAFLYKKVKAVDFSETIATSDLKVSRSRHLIEYMKVYEYLRSRPFLDLGPRSCTYKNSNQIFLNTTVPI